MNFGMHCGRVLSNWDFGERAFRLWLWEERGIDMIERQRMSDKENPNPDTASRVFPLYDGHGNTMAEIVRTGPTSADFVQGSLRKYDAWGNSRLNSAPSGFHGYCGNLGHKEDPESGLTYMRARYYEPGTGRFISQDPAYDGLNWYAYCGGNPVGRVDQSGKAWTVDWVIAGMAALSSFIVTLATTQNVGAAMVSLVSGFIVGLAAAMSSDAPKKSAMVVLMESTVGKFFAGGLANAAATWIVNAITGTETGIGDLVIAFICGGTGASFGSGMDLDEAFQGFIAGVLSSAGQKLIPSAIETFRS